MPGGGGAEKAATIGCLKPGGSFCAGGKDDVACMGCVAGDAVFLGDSPLLPFIATAAAAAFFIAAFLLACFFLLADVGSVGDEDELLFSVADGWDDIAKAPNPGGAAAGC
jgi:hypothetical protein